MRLVLRHMYLVLVLFVPAATAAGNDVPYNKVEQVFLADLEGAKSQKQRLHVLKQLTEDFIERHPERALPLAEELLEKTKHQKQQRAKSYLKMGQALYYLDKNLEALPYFLEAKKYAVDENKTDDFFLANIYYYEGVAESYAGDYIKAKRAQEKALHYASKRDDDELIAFILYELAYSEYGLDEFESGIEHSLQAYEIDVQRNDSSAIYADLNLLANVYNDKKQPDQAIEYFLESEKYISKTSPYYLENQITFHSNLGNTYLKKYEETKSEVYLEKAEKEINTGLVLAKRLSYKY
ncbi:MAG: hypothetical protein KTR13_00005, partial [Saprospiraceae bacterium]|nr:hypothetical protein [Saprospiraceae bacterium]